MAQQQTGDGPIAEAQAAVGKAAEHPVVRGLARVGLGAIGVTYMLVGGIAFRLALGPGGGANGERAPDQQAALYQIQSAPLGQVVLATIAVGLFGYTIWRLTEAIADVDGKGNDPKGFAQRGGHMLNGLVYGSIGLQAGLMALGTSGSGGSSQEEWTARFMALPFGQWLVGAAGLFVIGYGLYQFAEVWTRSYRDRLIFRRMSDAERRWIDPLSIAGLIAHGITLGMVGAFLIEAAVTFDPEQASGLSGALSELARQPFGPYLLGTVAVGLFAYGIYKLAQARYHRVLAR